MDDNMLEITVTSLLMVGSHNLVCCKGNKQNVFMYLYLYLSLSLCLCLLNQICREFAVKRAREKTTVAP